MNASSNPLLHQKHAKQYQEQQVITASKEQLLIMLYDGAIRFAKTGKKAILSQDYEKSNHFLVKTQRIITEFMGSLDLKSGNDTTQQLFLLYEYLHHQLVQANIQKNTALVDDVLEHLIDLRKTWISAIEIAQQETQKSSKPGQNA
ncbi:MAG: flagellar export chaperone FliS [Vampirovibrionales bacterium]